MKLYPDAALRYVNESGRVRTPKSRASALQHLRHLQSIHPNLQLDDFRYEHLHSYCLRARPDGERPAPATIGARRSQIRSFFAWTHFLDLVPTDPSAKLLQGVRVLKLAARAHTWLSEQQLAELLRLTDDGIVARRDRLILMTAGLSGLRVFEVAGLRWSKFTPDLTTLTIVGKASKLAIIGVPPQLVDELRAWRATCPPDTDTVFPAVRMVGNFSGTPHLDVLWNAPLRESGMRTVVLQAGRRIGVSPLRPHDLRRTFAGILEAHGVGIRDIMLAMRHGDTATTERYLEKSPARAMDVTRAFTINLEGATSVR